MINAKIQGRFIKLNQNKMPKHKLDISYTSAELENEAHVGLMIDKPYTVIDFDDAGEWEKAKTLVRAAGLKTLIMESDKGGHLWFKTTEPLKNKVDWITPIGLSIDIRSWGKKSFVMIKRNGKEREWTNIDEVSFEELDLLPKWLYPLSKNLDKSLVGMKDGEGRNTELFSWIIPLKNNGFEDSESVKEVFNLINEYIFEDPMEPTEIDAMLDGNDIFDRSKSIEKSYAQIVYTPYTNFQHNLFAMQFAQDFKVVSNNGVLWLYDGRQYINDQLLIERKMIDTGRIDLTDTQRKETLKYLKLLDSKSKLIDGKDYININNGLLNLKTGAIVPHTSNVFETNAINVDYDPEAYSKLFDNLLNEWMDDDLQLRAILEEWIGYCLVKDTFAQKALFNLGKGMNGKSVFFHALENFLGVGNRSTVSLDKIEENYQAAMLVGKLVNIGGDISANVLKESSIFKNLVTGETITTRRIYGEPFNFANTSKLSFAGNDLPPVKDRSDGFFRRFIIIPWIKNYKNNPKKDPYLKDKVITPEVKSYMLNLGLEGLDRLIENKGQFTHSDKVDRLVDKFRDNSNSVIQWMEYINFEKTIIASDTVSVYGLYSAFCETINTRPFALNKFIDYVIDYAPSEYPIELSVQADNKYFIKKIKGDK